MQAKSFTSTCLLGAPRNVPNRCNNNPICCTIVLRLSPFISQILPTFWSSPWNSEEVRACRGSVSPSRSPVGYVCSIPIRERSVRHTDAAGRVGISRIQIESKPIQNADRIRRVKEKYNFNKCHGLKLANRNQCTKKLTKLDGTNECN